MNPPRQACVEARRWWDRPGRVRSVLWGRVSTAWGVALWLWLLFPTAGLLGDGGFRDVAPGLAVRQDLLPEGPLAIHVVRVERRRSDLGVHPTLALGRRIGLSPLGTQLGRLPRSLGRPVAAINGDFYATENEAFPGDPRGLFIHDGELVSAPTERECLWLDPQGGPHAGLVQSRFSLTWPGGETTLLGLNESPDKSPAVLYTAAIGGAFPAAEALVLEPAGPGPWLPLRIGETYKARPVTGRRTLDAQTLGLVVSPELERLRQRLSPDAVLTIRTRTQPELVGTTTALGGGPVLVRGGRAQPATAFKSNERHPRSAFGWDAQSYFLAVVDGRQPGWSMGLTLPQFASYLARLGCEEAINLDGGGSTEVWLEGEILNRPCQGRERPTATALAILRKESVRTNAPAMTPPVRSQP